MTREEFGERVTALQNKLYRIAYSYLRNEHDTLDAVSDAILKAWQKQSSLRDDSLFERWLMRILIRESLNTLRKRKRMVLADTCQEQTQPCKNEALREALDALPPEQRIAVVLHYMEGYSIDEIAAILHTFRGTVASRLHYARLKLRALLKEDAE